ncbi:MAG TPA: hypothetical protein VHW65_09110 [Gemmatimonadales bacterium]|nr:hypothetical protein [Gemmatimonadales bacterium]
MSAAGLQLVVSGSATGATTATDDQTTSVIAAYGISSAANSTYYVGEIATAVSAITVTDSGTTPTITAGHDIRLRIPSGLNLIWDNTATAITASGNAAGKMVGTATYTSNGAVATINVSTSFAAGDQAR